jgi:hypothetical protein
MLKICFVMSVILDAWAPLTAFTFHGGSAHGRCIPNAKTKKRAVQQLCLRWWRPTLLVCCTFHACFGVVDPMHLSSSFMRLCTRSWMADTPLLHSKSQTLMGIK